MGLTRDGLSEHQRQEACDDRAARATAQVHNVVVDMAEPTDGASERAATVNASLSVLAAGVTPPLLLDRCTEERIDERAGETARDHRDCAERGGVCIREPASAPADP